MWKNNIVKNMIGKDIHSRNKKDTKLYTGRCNHCGSFVKDFYHPPGGGYFRCQNKKCKNYGKAVYYDMSGKISKITN